ncbi:hypothetical protein CXA82_06615 [Campylobacter upsaliensis]|nr:hypothetical protein [Campylobacter upsaliensis]
MSDKELEIFELCERLVDLLGDKEAVADLQTLLDRHPEKIKKFGINGKEQRILNQNSNSNQYKGVETMKIYYSNKKELNNE